VTETDKNPLGAIAELCLARGVRDIKSMPGLCHVVVDELWQCWVNGHRETLYTEDGAAVEPYHAYVEFNGWPAGIVSAAGCEFVAGALANVATFVAAVEAAKREAEGMRR
jgi:hypothetical protein